MEIFKEGFIGNNHMEVVDVDPGKTSTLKAVISETSMNPFEMAHGGFIFGLGDTAMGTVVGSQNKKAVTVSCNISYMRPAVGEYLLAKAEMVKNGKKICFLRADIYDDKDRLIATMDGNYCYIED